MNNQYPTFVTLPLFESDCSAKLNIAYIVGIVQTGDEKLSKVNLLNEKETVLIGLPAIDVEAAINRKIQHAAAMRIK